MPKITSPADLEVFGGRNARNAAMREAANPASPSGFRFLGPFTYDLPSGIEQHLALSLDAASNTNGGERLAGGGITARLVSGEVPPGLQLDSDPIVSISGKADFVGTWAPFTVVAIDSAKHVAFATFTISAH